MKAQELREKYLHFFIEKGHKQIPSGSLLPDNDPTVLFTTAGMHPLVPFLMGQPHPEGNRLVNIQKCIRTVDIEEVGNTTHHTFFEMMGNWSLGDYFNEDAIAFTFEFHTEILKIPLQRYAVSVFEGDENAPRDESSAKKWESLGISKQRIAFLPKKENWWGPAGLTGPCGPDTEIFYWSDDATVAPERFDHTDKRWVEIGNNVLLQYEKHEDQRYTELQQKNVDFGGGLERTLALMNNLDDNYLTDLFYPTIQEIEKLSGKTYGESENTTRSMRIIADHIRSAVFILGDQNGVIPSNVDQGYILRRLIRRAILRGKNLVISDIFTPSIAKTVLDNFKSTYPELEKNKIKVLEELKKEEVQFYDTLEKGMKEFEKVVVDGKITGRQAFVLFSTYGFPFEMTKELAEQKKISLDENDFKKEFEKHQELSRTAAAGRFKGGLADASEETIKLHTATHLLLAALRQVLGDHVYQKGSNITQDRLRLDFSHHDKMTPEQKKQVEDMVNEQIKKDLKVSSEIMTLEKAKKLNAMGVFEHKYGEKVNVYTIGDFQNPFSREICGGPHVEHTGVLKSFKLKKEESSSSGVRRIKALVE